MNLDFWFDYSSPYAYIASVRVADLSARTGANLRWRPMLLGAVFKAVGQADVPLLSFGEAKRRWYARDLVEQAEAFGAPFLFNPHFPLRTVLAARLTLAHPDPATFVHRVFRAAWAEGQDVTQLGVMRACGADAVVREGEVTDATILAAADAQRDALFANTTEAVESGVFGAPTFIVSGEGRGPWLFWGQDRMDMVEAALTGWVPPA